MADEFKTQTLHNSDGRELVVTTPAEQVAAEFDGFGSKETLAAVAKARAAEAKAAGSDAPVEVSGSTGKAAK